MINPYPKRARCIQWSNLSLKALLCLFMACTGITNAQNNSLTAPATNTSLLMVADVGATALALPTASACYGATEDVEITIMNHSASAVDFSTDPVTVTVNVTGAVTQTLSATINSGMLAASSTMNVNTGTLNMTTPGIYTFNASTSSAGDSNTSNDAMPPVTRTTYAVVPLPQSVSFTGFTGGNLSTAFPGWREASGTAAAGSTSFWTFQNNVGTQGNTTARINLFTTSRNEWLIGPRITASANTVLRFKAAVTDLGSPSNPDIMGSDDQVKVMISSDCGATWAPVMTLDTSYHFSPVLTQYGIHLGSYAGQDIMIAFYATDGPVDDINNYDFHLDDINISDVSGIDVGITGLASPVTPGCFSTNETITVNLRNHGFTTVDLSVDNIVVQVNVAGPNPQSFSVTVNSGMLAPGTIMPVTVTTAYDMTMAGIYTFNAFSSAATNDYDPQNDAMLQEYLVSTKPGVSVSQDAAICSGSSITLSASGTAYGPAPGDVEFSSASAVAIVDLDTVYSTISITSPLYAFDVYSVTIDSLYHSYDADLDIYLIAPNGSRIELTSDNGTNGNNYMGTRFIPSAPGSVIAGIPPFTGDYLPEQPFSMLSGNANGIWKLQVIDDGSGDNGILKGWSINMKAANSIAGYSWSPATGLSSASVANPAASPLSTTTYTVTVTDQNGCTSTEDILVTVNPSPLVTTSNDTTICEGTSATLIASGGSSYAWDNNAGNDDTVIVSPLTNTMYTVTVTGNNGCTATGQVAVNIAPLAVASFSYNNTGNNVAFTNNSSNATSYTWDFGDGSPVDNSFSPSYTYTVNGTYTVTLVASNSCNADTVTDVVTIFATGIAEAGTGALSITPNPSEGIFNIKLDNTGNTPVRIEVMDMQGRMLFLKAGEYIAGAKLTQIDLSGLARGAYHLKVTSGSSVSIKKIILQ